MKGIAGLAGLTALAGAVLVLGGCSPQQQAQANSEAQRARQQFGKASVDARQAIGDDTVTLKVKAALGASDQVNTSAVHVKTKNHVVYLMGAVGDSKQKAVALRIAKDTVGAGVKVVDQLKVQPPAK